MKTNVLFMQSQTYFGADSYIHSLLMRELNRQYFDVFVACNYGDGEERSAAAQALERIPNLYIRRTYFGASVNQSTKSQITRDVFLKGLPAGYNLAMLLSYIRRNHIKVIHCTEKPRDAFFGFVLSRLTGAKCLIHLHVKAENWISPMVRWAMKNADALVGVSDFVAQSIVEMGYSPDRTFSVQNGIDIERWNPNLDGDRIRQEFKIPAGTPLLAVISRLFSWKGHAELLKALALIKERIPDFRLLIVGEDDPRANPGGGSYRETLVRMVNELGLLDRVIFTGYRRDIPEIMAACDLFTMPSFEEPFGMVYLEAMAMKKPVIALDNGGAREVVEHGRSGLLSIPQDIEKLAENIFILIKDPELRHRMGEYGRHRVESFFTPGCMARDVEQIYRRLIDLPTTANPIRLRETISPSR